MKPSIPKGTRDFSPQEMMKRNFIIQTIVQTYQRYGYKQIETPAMENLSTLEGKYGEEGDKLLFRILNSGLKPEDLKNAESINAITEKGLRYDLTVPFARYVVMHQNEITFPFKRYQVQPVWRADRPQKGRYREFIQCDADVIGSTSLLNEVEMVMMIDEVFAKLALPVIIKVNNRKILTGITEVFNLTNRFIEFTVLIDKLDKHFKDRNAIVSELQHRFNLSENDAQEIAIGLILQNNENDAAGNLGKIDWISSILAHSRIAQKGLQELMFLFSFIELKSELINSTLFSKFVFKNLKSSIIQLDLSLARGLNYYTGAIFEVKVNHPGSNFTGSILGGGRYDDLTGIFGLPNVSGVGISFGIDRIYDVMEELNLFNNINLQSSSTQVLFVNFGDEEVKYILPILQQVRAAGINAELYPDAVKLKKQMSYADSNKIPFVVMAGTEEKAKNILKVKIMVSGAEKIIPSDNLNNLLDTLCEPGFPAFSA